MTKSFWIDNRIQISHRLNGVEYIVDDSIERKILSAFILLLHLLYLRGGQSPFSAVNCIQPIVASKFWFWKIAISIFVKTEFIRSTVQWWQRQFKKKVPLKGLWLRNAVPMIKQ